MANRHNIKLSLQIIESPSPDEIFDARTEGSLLRESLGVAGLPAFYNIAVNADKFVDALAIFITRRAQESDSLPILHLSMHGHPDGVSLTDGEFLTWDQLRRCLESHLAARRFTISRIMANLIIASLVAVKTS